MKVAAELIMKQIGYYYLKSRATEETVREQEPKEDDENSYKQTAWSVTNSELLQKSSNRQSQIALWET